MKPSDHDLHHLDPISAGMIRYACVYEVHIQPRKHALGDTDHTAVPTVGHDLDNEMDLLL